MSPRGNDYVKYTTIGVHNQTFRAYDFKYKKFLTKSLPLPPPSRRIRVFRGFVAEAAIVERHRTEKSEIFFEKKKKPTIITKHRIHFKI